MGRGRPANPMHLGHSAREWFELCKKMYKVVARGEKVGTEFATMSAGAAKKAPAAKKTKKARKPRKSKK